MPLRYNHHKDAARLAVLHSPQSPCSRRGLSPLPFSHLCAGGQIPLAKSNGAGNWSGRETISKVRSAGAGEQWLCDIPSRTQCATHNWKAFVIWLPFDYDVQDVNTNMTGVTMAEEHVHTEFPGFTSQFKVRPGCSSPKKKKAISNCLPPLANFCRRA